MEPRIQYAKTADGVSIAFSTMGEGTPFVAMPNAPISHVQLDWHVPGLRRWNERVGQNRMLVRYDSRGSGLSERRVSDYSLDVLVLDLEAVVDRLGLERFALIGWLHTGPVAIRYAVRHPERVSHLLLWSSYARGSDYAQSAQVRATRRLIDQDWEMYTETLAHTTFGWSEAEEARRYAAYFRECTTPEAAQALFLAARDFDVTALLPSVTTPTLVLHRRQVAWVPLEVVQELAARIPTARLALLEGASVAPWVGEMEAAASAIDQFLREGEEAAVPAAAPSGLVSILFTDVEGSTSLTQRLGDSRARDVLRTHERIVRDALHSHGGSEVKTMGDGFMASFSSATRALECAISMQRAFAEHNENAEEPIRVRVGLNAGEPIAEEEDLFGTTVIVAARIAAKAEGGEILAANVVRELAAGKGFLFSDRGDVILRGFEDPVRLYEVRWTEKA